MFTPGIVLPSANFGTASFATGGVVSPPVTTLSITSLSLLGVISPGESASTAAFTASKFPAVTPVIPAVA